MILIVIVDSETYKRTFSTPAERSNMGCPPVTGTTAPDM